jgi:hypothetical protein
MVHNTWWRKSLLSTAGHLATYIARIVCKNLWTAVSNVSLNLHTSVEHRHELYRCGDQGLQTKMTVFWCQQVAWKLNLKVGGRLLKAVACWKSPRKALTLNIPDATFCAKTTYIAHPPRSVGISHVTVCLAWTYKSSKNAPLKDRAEYVRDEQTLHSSSTRLPMIHLLAQDAPKTAWSFRDKMKNFLCSATDWEILVSIDGSWFCVSEYLGRFLSHWSERIIEDFTSKNQR